MMRIVKQVLFVFITLWGTAASGQDIDFAQALGGASFDSGLGLDIDAEGNIYVGGRFKGTSLIGNTSLVSQDELDIFLAKMDDTGTVEWVNSIGGQEDDLISNLTVDAAGNVYIVGLYRGDVNFDANTRFISDGGGDCYLAKYNTDGILEWVVRGVGNESNAAFDVAVDIEGNAWFTGRFTGTMTVLDAERNQSVVLESAGGTDVYVLKFDPDGALLAFNSAGGPGNDLGNRITTGLGGEVYLGGEFEDTVNFGTDLTSIGGADVFYASLDVDAEPIWVVSEGGQDTDESRGVAVGEDGDLYAIGTFEGTATFGNTTLNSVGDKDIYVGRYDASNGDVEWIIQGGGAQQERVGGIVVADERVYIGGAIQDVATFGSIVHRSAGREDIFAAQLSTDGVVEWFEIGGGALNDRTRRLRVDNQGRLYLTGEFNETATFFDGTSITATGDTDAFLLRIIQPPSIPVPTFPDDGATDQPSTVRLAWEPAAAAQIYRVQYADNSALTNDTQETTTNTELTISDLTPNTTYFWRVRAINDSGSSAFSPLHSFTTSSVTAPSIAHTPVSSPVPANDDLEIAADVTDASGLDQVHLLFQKGGQSSEQTVVMNNSTGDTFVGIIPAAQVNETGLQYRIVAGNNAGLESETGPFALQVQVDDLSTSVATSGKTTESYQLVTVPLLLDNPSARAVFEDDLGTYNTEQWRLFSLGADQQYDEFPNTAAVTPGKGFFLAVAQSGKHFTTGPGMSLSVGEIYSVNLHAGWNLIGNPYAFALNLSNVSMNSGQALDIRTYTGEFQTQTSALQSFVGYAVFANAADQLMFAPQGGNVASAKAEAALAWSVSVVAEGPDGIRDSENVLGVAEGATVEWDEFDRAEAPVIGSFVRLQFPHPEWEAPVYGFTRDVQPAGQENYTWTFTVDTNVPDAPIDLRFEGLDTLPKGIAIQLIDPLTGVRVDLQQQTAYTFVADGTARTFRIEVGPEGEVEVPDVQALWEGYPNPFHGAVTLRFGLKAAAAVDVRIYDVTGRQVRLLQQSSARPAGYHTVVWDGRGIDGQLVPSGLYFGVLRTVHTVRTVPLTIIR